MNGSRSVKQQLEERPVQREKTSPWVGLMALVVVCATIVVIAYIIFALGC